MQRTIIWDFDGTLAERREGWSGAIVEVIREHNSASTITPDQVRTFLRTGFPWHAHERHHPELADADAWWGALLPVFEAALCGVGMVTEEARRIAPRVREKYL